MNQSRGQADVLTQLAATYSKQAGVKVTIDTVGPTDFLAKLQSKSQSGSMPDIFSATSLTDMGPYYKAGWALNLQDQLAGAWGKTFTPAALALTTVPADNASGIPAGIFSAHWEVATYGLYLNTDLFKTAGIETATPPATSAELIDQLTKVSHSGPGGFSVAASLTPLLLQSYASNWLSDKQVNDTFAGKASWKSEAWRKSLQFIADLRDAGVIANNSIPGGTDDNPNVEKSFFSVRDVSTIFDGSFAVAVAGKTAPDFTTYTTSGLAKAADGNLAPRSPGIVGKGAAVNAKGKKVDASLAFVKWLTEPAQEQVFMDSIGIIPANAELLSAGKLSPQVAGFGTLIKTMQVVPTPLSSDVASAIGTGTQGLVLKEKTVDQVLDDLEKAQSSR